MPQILAVTSAGACGIAAYSQHLHENLPKGWEWQADSAWLDPDRFDHDISYIPSGDVVVWLNHHAGLHSRWTADHIRHLQMREIPVVVTLHDTRAGERGSENSEQLLSLYRVANATIVHEPVVDMLGAHLIRQGVPAGAYPYWYNATTDVRTSLPELYFKQYPKQPVLGTVGFNFPWKNYDQLCEVTREVGWAVVLLSNNATEDDEARWRAINPWILVNRTFLLSSAVVSYLSGCDATAFCYTCANNGTSGAIRQGIAARKPVYAFGNCRQFRDIWIAEANEEPDHLIRWVKDFNHLHIKLRTDTFPPFDAGMVYVAERDSWTRQAQTYADIFLGVLNGVPA